jgi:alkanesulfonate monooxygenase SsuD/methylene tetrahydromethanopterin reductase-like flavin-dependent oxidoreductase (luciferase family)
MSTTKRGFGLFAGVSSEVIQATAKDAESLGYDSFWVNHPGTMDGLAKLGEAGRVTRTIDLGVGVIPLTGRPPESIVAGVRQNNLPLDRLLLGVGSPNPEALRRVREGIAALRAAFPDRSLRIVVAALGPKMCHLAGELADGVLFNWLTPEHARVSGEWVREGAARVGRPAPTLYAYVRGALGPDAATRLASEGARYQGVPAYADHFTRMGRGPLETSVQGDDAAALQSQLAAWNGAVDEVVIRAVTANDTVEQTLALLRACAPESG